MIEVGGATLLSQVFKLHFMKVNAKHAREYTCPMWVVLQERDHELTESES
jgi:hypothetical protein